MSYRAAARHFAALAARHRQEVHGGQPDDASSDGSGNNFSVADPASASGVRQFRAAFALLATRREIEVHGFLVDCHAVVTLPDALGLTLTLDSVLTYLPTAGQFKVCELGGRTALAAERRYGLRRLEP